MRLGTHAFHHRTEHSADVLNRYLQVEEPGNGSHHVQSPTTFAPPDLKQAEVTDQHHLRQTSSLNQVRVLQEPSLDTETGSEPHEHGSSVSEESTASKAKLKLVTALEDTSIFLGGLIKHPVESTKYFTILRHSHGLVYYKGPNTSISISIFSDTPLLPNRRYWLQSKGWTGNTGMAAKAFFRANNNWIHVTPDRQVSASELPLLDERAWQRDIKKFVSKATRTQQKHVLRETALVRIPFEATDGYFRIVLTGGDSKQVLCPSPVFRVASTSMSASSLRGASLATLPVELGIKAAQTAATTIVTTAVSPFATVVKDRITSAATIMQYKDYAQTVWDTSGAQDRIDVVNERYEERMVVAEEQRGLHSSSTEMIRTRSNIVGNEDGPTFPFPVRLNSVVAKGTGEGTTAFDMPTANLDAIPPDVLASFGVGHYFGWAFVIPQDKSQIFLHDQWRQARITILYKHSKTVKVAQQKVIRVHLIHEFPLETFFIGARLDVVIMGYLRPLVPYAEQEVVILENVNDIIIAQSSLSRPAWGQEVTLQRVRTAQSARSMTEKLVDMRIAGQRQVDRIPVHVLGVRNDGFGMHDRGAYGNGGIWVKRD